MVSPFAHQQYVANVLLQPQMFNQQAWNPILEFQASTGRIVWYLFLPAKT